MDRSSRPVSECEKERLNGTNLIFTPIKIPRRSRSLIREIHSLPKNQYLILVIHGDVEDREHIKAKKISVQWAIIIPSMMLRLLLFVLIQDRLRLSFMSLSFLLYLAPSGMSLSAISHIHCVLKERLHPCRG